MANATLDPDQVKAENFRIHEKEAEWYDRLHREIWNFAEQRRINDDIDRICGLVGTGTVLDIGCGSGNLSLKFLDRGFEVTGIDISQRMIDVLQSKIDRRGQTADLICRDIDDFLAKNRETTYSVICLSSVLHHLPRLEETMGEMAARLRKPGAIYVCHEPTASEISSSLGKLLKNIDPFVSPRWFFARLTYRLLNGKSDYSISDCHKSIDSVALQKLFADAGLVTDRLEFYNCYRNGALVTLDELLKIKRKSSFRLIARTV